MRGPTLADDFYALEARVDELLVERDRLAEDNEALRGERDDAYALLRRCLGWLQEGPDSEQPEPLMTRIREVLP